MYRQNCSNLVNCIYRRPGTAIITRVSNTEKAAEQNIKRAEQYHAAVLSDIRKYRKQIDNVVDVWEREIRERVGDTMNSDIAKLRNVVDKCERLLDCAKQQLEITDCKVRMLEVGVIETEATNTFREYKFVRNENISNLLKLETAIGSIKVLDEVAGLYKSSKNFDNCVPRYRDEIYIKADNEIFECDITGMVLTGTQRLVVADSANKSLKCVDTKRNKIISRLCFSSSHWDVTMVHRDQVAVTIPNEKIIQFVLAMGSLKTSRHIKVNGECRGITFSQENLIVSFRSPGKIQIINLHGNIMKTITQIGLQEKLFEWPDYVAFSKGDDSIYVSDWHRNAIIRLTMKGEVTGVHNNSTGTNMSGIIVLSDGNVLICKRASHSIIKLSQDCQRHEIFLEEKHGLKYPWSLCFCDVENKLYVDNNRNNNTIAVFEMQL